MQKGLLSFLFLTFSLPALAQGELPAALSKIFQPGKDENQNAIWVKKDNPQMSYDLCLDKTITSTQRIVVMCGNVIDADEVDSGSFDIWYLSGEKISSHDSKEGIGRMGSSGSAQVVKIGTEWGVILESSYMMQGVEQTRQDFYLPQGSEIHLVASVPVYSSNKDSCLQEQGDECAPDDLKVRAIFAKESKDVYPNMLIHATGKITGEKIDKHWSVPFDLASKQYPIPEVIDIGY